MGHPSLLIKKKVANTSSFAKRKHKHQNETQETKSQRMQRTATIEYKRHGLLSPE